MFLCDIFGINMAVYPCTLNSCLIYRTEIKTGKLWRPDLVYIHLIQISEFEMQISAFKYRYLHFNADFVFKYRYLYLKYRYLHLKCRYLYLVITDTLYYPYKTCRSTISSGPRRFKLYNIKLFLQT